MENVDFFRLCKNFTYVMQKAFSSIQNIKECFFLAFLARKKTYEKRSIFWQKPWTNPFAKERFFFDFVRTSLLRSKELFFLSRISKNVSLRIFFAKKKKYERKVDFLTKTKSKVKICFLLLFCSLKSILFYPEYQKMFLYGFFLLKKKNMRERSIFWQKPWTNPFAKCRFFLLC